jgi:hypothetical protein
MAKRADVNWKASHRQAQEALLRGLLAGNALQGLVDAVGRFYLPGSFSPDVAMLDLAVTALDLACPAGAEPLAYEGLRERHLPEVTFRGSVEHHNSQYALYAAACMRGGLRPDLLADAGWWQSPLWAYAVFAAVIYVRAAAARLDVSVTEVAERIAATHDIELPAIR